VTFTRYRNRIAIVAAKRTPFGKFRGGLAALSPVDLAIIAGEAVLANIDRSMIDQVILGNVMGAGHGMNIARQVAIGLDLSIETTATTVNLMCGSGMHAALMAVTAIRAGEAQAVLVGGTESMSQTRLLLPRPGKGEQPDLTAAIDALQRDGLVDSFNNQHMGQHAENLAAQFQLSREVQDAFALRSQQLYRTALAQGHFADEVVAAGTLTADEHPRLNVTLDELTLLKPAFRAPENNGTVTAGNASGINDGAAMLVVADFEFATSRGWPILAEWIDGTVVGCDPERMGLGPVHAIRKLMERTQSDWSRIDNLEINEAFASQALACLQGLQLTLACTADTTTVSTPSGQRIPFNREGGAIAIGHPLAASGARLLTHLAWNIARNRSRAAIGSLCIGGGMGIAAMLAKP
jgi:acetyl-CoA C-acetyltransferase